MNSTHVHLLLNHFPIIGIMIGTVLLFYGVWKKNTSIQRISLATIVVMALIAIPVFLTGEPAEESVENLPGVVKATIEEHEEASEIAFWSMMLAGAISLMSVVLQMLQNKMAKTSVMLALLVSTVTSVLMARAGYLGGQIRHTEVQGNAVANSASELNPNQEQDDD